jgi:hypothetical protein
MELDHHHQITGIAHNTARNQERRNGPHSYFEQLSYKKFISFIFSFCILLCSSVSCWKDSALDKF